MYIVVITSQSSSSPVGHSQAHGLCLITRPVHNKRRSPMNRICHHTLSRDCYKTGYYLCVGNPQPNRGWYLAGGIRGARKTCEKIKLIDDRSGSVLEVDWRTGCGCNGYSDHQTTTTVLNHPMPSLSDAASLPILNRVDHFRFVDQVAFVFSN